MLVEIISRIPLNEAFGDFFIRRARLQPCDCLCMQQGNHKGLSCNGIEFPVRIKLCRQRRQLFHVERRVSSLYNRPEGQPTVKSLVKKQKITNSEEGTCLYR